MRAWSWDYVLRGENLYMQPYRPLADMHINSAHGYEPFLYSRRAACTGSPPAARSPKGAASRWRRCCGAPGPGAAAGVTGSCHLLEVRGKKILIDCGLQQGGDELDDNALPFAAGEIDCEPQLPGGDERPPFPVHVVAVDADVKAQDTELIHQGGDAGVEGVEPLKDQAGAVVKGQKALLRFLKGGGKKTNLSSDFYKILLHFIQKYGKIRTNPRELGIYEGPMEPRPPKEKKPRLAPPQTPGEVRRKKQERRLVRSYFTAFRRGFC